ncbi:hypothetical protein F5Y16DRAFT_423620 [Xylariaceae sp. FL0255]|nr:hypothetical protein F5Y16DRAFT_423620 [Xylariaceae sp. FL0255]
MGAMAKLDTAMIREGNRERAQLVETPWTRPPPSKWSFSGFFSTISFGLFSFGAKDPPARQLPAAVPALPPPPLPPPLLPPPIPFPIPGPVVGRRCGIECNICYPPPPASPPPALPALPHHAPPADAALEPYGHPSDDDVRQFLLGSPPDAHRRASRRRIPFERLRSRSVSEEPVAKRPRLFGPQINEDSDNYSVKGEDSGDDCHRVQRDSSYYDSSDGEDSYSVRCDDPDDKDYRDESDHSDEDDY